MTTENNIASEITPEVGSHIAAVNQSRIEQNADFRYHRIFWGAYKQHVHELLVGISAGGAVGAVLGLATIAFFGWPAIVIGAAAGIVYTADKISSIGSASGAHAASLAERHASALDPANENNPLKIADDHLMTGKGGHHYDFKAGESKKKYFYWQSGLVGTGIGAATGALLGTLGVYAATAGHFSMAALPVIGHIVTIGVLAGLGPVAAPIVAGALIFGILGFTFGIDRGLFKSIFNKVDAFVTGRKGEPIDHGREQAQAMGISDEDLHNRRLQRQEDIHALQDAYDKNIFMGGMRGWLKGFAGGIALGLAIGALVGGLALAGVAIAGVAITATVATAVVGTAVVGFAGYFGTVFSEAGFNAGTESTTRAINDELPRSQAAAQGIAQEPPDIHFSQDKTIVGKTLDTFLGGIRKVSEASKNMYHQLNDYPGAPGSKEAVELLAQVNADAQANKAAADYYAKITLEEARELDRKLGKEKSSEDKDAKQNESKSVDRTSNIAPKNISAIIKEPGLNYPDFTTMLANQKTDFTPTPNKN